MSPPVYGRSECERLDFCRGPLSCAFSRLEKEGPARFKILCRNGDAISTYRALLKGSKPGSLIRFVTDARSHRVMQVTGRQKRIRLATI